MVFDEFNPLDVLAAAAELSGVGGKKKLVTSPSTLLLTSRNVAMQQQQQQAMAMEDQGGVDYDKRDNINDKDVDRACNKSNIEQQLRILTSSSSTTDEVEEESSGRGSMMSSPPHSAGAGVVDLLDHPYAGSAAVAGMVAAALQQHQALTDDDDGYSSRSSVDSPSGHAWRCDEAADTVALAAAAAATSTPVCSSSSTTQASGDASCSATDDACRPSTSDEIAGATAVSSSSVGEDGDELTRPVQQVHTPVADSTTSSSSSVGGVEGESSSSTSSSATPDDDNRQQQRADFDVTTSAVSASDIAVRCNVQADVGNLAVSSAAVGKDDEDNDTTIVLDSSLGEENELSVNAASTEPSPTEADASIVVVVGNDSVEAAVDVNEVTIQTNVDATTSLSSAGVDGGAVGGAGQHHRVASGISQRYRPLRCSTLHPLVEHDYCTFAEFSAEIQSSIIATTDLRQRTERQKSAAAAAAAGTTATKSRLLAYMGERGQHRQQQKMLAAGGGGRKVAGAAGWLMLGGHHKATGVVGGSSSKAAKVRDGRFFSQPKRI
jgi:hypothetical protein